ncbi:uncharacterized protein HD556DRAFT_1448631 [Suillus plorans]|uniref:Uncharacterized protein n=1 Tax=Suillus plorans TaxID=116603 RepID=A0A9P7AED8_9AGAM|nr:uncharacterized protein HD556DRAFT_1448631 [Suillus plorans]KAG1787615.1 hypothetical protein HD556DRAFT_1448631 [Suillus plorans]
MPAAKWTTNEQYVWLQDRLATYMVHAKERDYSHFWAPCRIAWFAQFPERAVIYPDIPMDVELTCEQEQVVKLTEQARETQLHTWFHWRVNKSKKNRSLKKKLTAFDDTLQPKRRAKSEAEIYSEMYYDERIKPLVMAEQEAGNVATSSKRMALGRKFSKELLEDETKEIKAEIREKYEEQLTHKKHAKRGKNILDDDGDGDNDDNDEELDVEAIMQGIDDLPVICQHFAKLVKQKTRFMVSFMFAGPDPRNDWDMTTLSCHPSETPQGDSFAELYQTADSDFLAAFQQYAEQIFPGNKRKPDTYSRNKVESSEIGGFTEEESEEREEDGEECEEDGDKDEEGEEDEPNVQSTDVKEESQLNVDEGEANQSMESAVTLPIPGASLGDASGAPDASSLGGSSVMHASMETTASYGTPNDASYYGMAMYDTQPQPMYGTHAMYGGQDRMYGTQGPTYDAQGTGHALLAGNSCLTESDVSLHSQGIAFPIQTSNYINFGIPPSNLFMPGAVTPEFSFDQGFQAANWNNQAWNMNNNNPAWNFGDGAEGGTPRGGLQDLLNSLPALPSPEPNEDSQPVLPSPNPILSTDNTSLPSIGKARMTTGRRVAQKGTQKGDSQKCPNTKSMIGRAAAKPSAETATQPSPIVCATKNKQPPGQAKSSSKKLSVTKPSPAHDQKKQPPAAKALADEAAATMNIALDTEVRRKRVPIKSRCNDLADAIGTNSVSFFAGKENLLEAEAPCLLKRCRTRAGAGLVSSYFTVHVKYPSHANHFPMLSDANPPTRRLGRIGPNVFPRTCPIRVPSRLASPTSPQRLMFIYMYFGSEILRRYFRLRVPHFYRGAVPRRLVVKPDIRSS